MSEPTPADAAPTLSTTGSLLLTVGGLGRLRPAPGTWGSLPPALLALGVLWLGGSAWAVHGVVIVVGVIFAAACLRFGDDAERHFAGKDPSSVVADEVAGQCVALLALPWRVIVDGGTWTWNLALAGIAFLAFRLFDIVKVPPAYGMQRWPGGRGILADDLVAGVYAALVTQAFARWLLPGWLG